LKKNYAIIFFLLLGVFVCKGKQMGADGGSVERV